MSKAVAKPNTFVPTTYVPPVAGADPSKADVRPFFQYFMVSWNGS